VAAVDAFCTSRFLCTISIGRMKEWNLVNIKGKFKKLDALVLEQRVVCHRTYLLVASW